MTTDDHLKACCFWNEVEFMVSVMNINEKPCNFDDLIEWKTIRPRTVVYIATYRVNRGYFLEFRDNGVVSLYRQRE